MELAYVKNSAISVQLRLSAGNLLWGPFLGQPCPHGSIDLGVIHLTSQWTFPSSLLGLPLCSSGVVLIPRTVALQLPADGGSRTPQGPSNFLLIEIRVPHLR